MTFNQVITSIFSIVLIVFFILMLYETYKDSQNIDYVFCAERMLLEAIHDYQTFCINEHINPIVDYNDIMEYKEACNLHSLNWKDYIETDKLEILKPYLPENPEKYIKNAIKKRDI